MKSLLHYISLLLLITPVIFVLGLFVFKDGFFAFVFTVVLLIFFIIYHFLFLPTPSDDSVLNEYPSIIVMSKNNFDGTFTVNGLYTAADFWDKTYYYAKSLGEQNPVSINGIWYMIITITEYFECTEIRLMRDDDLKQLSRLE